MRQYDIHLVGSIPLRDAAEVYETVSSALGPRLLRIPDGETGDRTGWMGWLNPDFQLHPDLEPTDETFRPHAAGRATVRYRLKASSNADRFEFTNLRHASVAIDAYKTFARLKDEKKIPQHCRYQFALAHPVSIAGHYGVAEAQPVIEREYERALVREIEKMAAAIPHDQLAIQWDVASAIFASLQRSEPTRHGSTKEEMLEAFCASCARLGEAVPMGVDLLYHLCYGDSGHRHAIEPVDMADMVEFASRLSARVSRPIQLFHMPVPRDRDDASYFEPLGLLAIPPKSRISLGLIHLTDGEAGSARRLAMAEKHLPDFLIATECGFGRRPPETIPALLRLHAALAGMAPGQHS
jgi:hypothetical protein